MTLHLDMSTGSKDLLEPLQKIMKPEHKLNDSHFESGDVKWKGANGLRYGVEVKHLSDILSCMSDGRFASQLAKMQPAFDVYWLLLVDEFKGDDEFRLWFKKLYGGVVPKWILPYVKGKRGRVTYDGLISWLTTMEVLGGCRLWHVQTNEQAAMWLYSKYKWSLKKKHSSLNVFDTSRPAPRKNKKTGVRIVGRPTKVMKVAFVLVDGIGWDKAKALSREFSTPELFFAATELQLLAVKGIGKKLATEIRSSITGYVPEKKEKGKRKKR